MAFATLCLASCMGDSYADPDMTEQVPASPWGNNKLKEKNVVTIAQLKSDNQTQINEVAVQDATGAILVKINGSGLYGYLPVGQDILIDLKGLYIGGNGKQAEIGGVYTNNKNGNTAVGNIDRATWEKHFKILDEADPSKVVPEEFDLSKLGDEEYITANAGKLMTIRKVRLPMPMVRLSGLQTTLTRTNLSLTTQLATELTTTNWSYALLDMPVLPMQCCQMEYMTLQVSSQDTQTTVKTLGR